MPRWRAWAARFGGDGVELLGVKIAQRLIGRCRIGAQVSRLEAACALQALEACSEMLRQRRGHALELHGVRSAISRVLAGHRPSPAHCARAMQALREVEKDLQRNTCATD